MKKIIISVLAVLAVIMTAPLCAHARVGYDDNFNDGVRDVILWTEGGNTGSSKLSLSETGGVLSFTASGVSANPLDEISRSYESTWVADFSRDFTYVVNYNNPFSSAGVDGIPVWGGTEIGLHKSGLELWSSAENKGLNKIFDASIWNSNDDFIKQAGRSDTGTIGVSYSVATDTLNFIGITDQGVDVLSGAQILDFTKTYDATGLHVYLRGWTEGANFNASLDNFQGPVATPEPVSSALFLLGGAALAIKRRKVKV